MRACGRGTVTLELRCARQKYSIQLENVLYIPKMKNNLFSLGRWEANGCYYSGQQGKINLFSQNGACVPQGQKIENNLYKICLYLPSHNHTGRNDFEHAFASSLRTPTWESWHKRFGHISYSGLQHLHDLQLVNGFTIDEQSPKPDCIACIEVKQTVKPFGKDVIHNTTTGELTHIDLWGKYPVTSIHRNQYYILMVDDSTRHVTLNFLKLKSQAPKHIQNYLTHLTTKNKRPRAIRVDRGGEFLNAQLENWCQENGIQIEATALYSPSQNGVAERMNRTLVELARAMLIANNVPEFLWKPAVAHAAYLWNQSFTHSVPCTPYEQWHMLKPNIAHLHEYGTLVWILMQGQKLPCKMMQKLQRKIFVGYDNRAKAVKYYNTETRKILTSRNFHFLALEEKGSCNEEIMVAPDTSHEGELEGGTQDTGDGAHGEAGTKKVSETIHDSTILRDNRDSLKRKSEEEDTELQKM